MSPTSLDVAPTKADFPLQYQNSTKESKRFQAKYQDIIIMPSLYVYGRQVGISRGSVCIGRSQVGTDRYKSGLSLHTSG